MPRGIPDSKHKAGLILSPALHAKARLFGSRTLPAQCTCLALMAPYPEGILGAPSLVEGSHAQLTCHG